MSDETNDGMQRAATLKTENKIPFLAQWAGALLLASALFALAALVAFGSLGRQTPWGWSFAALGALCWLGWLLGRRQSTKIGGIASDAYSRQRAVLGANAILSVLLFLALMVGVNYIAARRHKVFDLTKNRAHSLSPQTYKALEKLKAPLNLIYIWAPSEAMPQPDPQAQAVLESFQAASDKVRVEYLNAAQGDLRLRQMKLTTFTGQPLLLVEPQSKDSKDSKAGVSTPSPTSSKRQEVSVVDESNITSAILKINDPRPRVLYFLTGHGELSPLQTGTSARISMSGASAALAAQNYTVKPLSLAGLKAQIPSDAEAVICVAPRVDLSSGEAQKLKRYVSGKGRLLLFFDPPQRPLVRWKGVLSSMGVEMQDGVVLEFSPQQMLQSPQYVIGLLDDPSRHPILRAVNGHVVFPGVVALRTQPTPDPRMNPQGANTPVATPLFATSNQSQMVSLRGNQMQGGASGPFVIAAAVEKGSAPPAMPGMAAPPANNNGLRAVVTGNANFCTDAAFNQFGNTSFFLGAINWVVGNEALVSIPPKEPVTNTISMNSAMQRFAVLFSLLALPILLLIIGTMVWWKRR